jgi:hypothetical protein
MFTDFQMGAESTSETSINFYYTTRRNNLEDSHFQVVKNLQPPYKVLIKHHVLLLALGKMYLTDRLQSSQQLAGGKEKVIDTMSK